MKDELKNLLDAEEQTSRRDALRRGAVVGGAVLWAVPMVQSVAMAQTTQGSAPPPTGGGTDCNKCLCTNSSGAIFDFSHPTITTEQQCRSSCATGDGATPFLSFTPCPN